MGTRQVITDLFLSARLTVFIAPRIYVVIIPPTVSSQYFSPNPSTVRTLRPATSYFDVVTLWPIIRHVSSMRNGQTLCGTIIYKFIPHNDRCTARPIHSAIELSVTPINVR